MESIKRNRSSNTKSSGKNVLQPIVNNQPSVKTYFQSALNDRINENDSSTDAENDENAETPNVSDSQNGSNKIIFGGNDRSEVGCIPRLKAITALTKTFNFRMPIYEISCVSETWRILG